MECSERLERELARDGARLSSTSPSSDSAATTKPCLIYRAVDPHSFLADPAVFLNADPDPAA